MLFINIQESDQNNAPTLLPRARDGKRDPGGREEWPGKMGRMGAKRLENKQKAAKGLNEIFGRLLSLLQLQFRAARLCCRTRLLLDTASSLLRGVILLMNYPADARFRSACSLATSAYKALIC